MLQLQATRLANLCFSGDLPYALLHVKFLSLIGELMDDDDDQS